mgnify:CR=1 FL=1
MKRLGIGVVCAVLWSALASPAQAQVPPVKNPIAVEFDCPDHAGDTGHEVDIINAIGVVVQTLTVGDPPAVNGRVTVNLNVQPISFGAYTIKIRAVALEVKSVDSVPSDVWERVPGQPSRPVVR